MLTSGQLAIAVRPYRGAHFATFPVTLVAPCLLAGSSARACELCGAAWISHYENVAIDARGSGNKARKARADYGGPAGTTRRQAHAVPWEPMRRALIGQDRTCSCSLAAGTARSLVLDPFGGAGTTAIVADALARDVVLVELNPKYAKIAEERCATQRGTISTAAIG